jgi:4-hydroxy-tetrahydrodipicolinate synthase
MVTPFVGESAERVDVASLRRLCDFLIEAGVHGLYPCGTTGENALLTTAERMTVAQTVVEAAGRRVPVFVHTGAAGTAETVALTRHAREIGADGVGAITPYYYAYTDDDLRRHYLAAAEAAAPLPLYLYNLPSYARNRISPALADALRRAAPNIVGIKDSSGDLDALRAFRGIPDFSVLSGTDGMNLAALDLGCDGMISGNANACPAPFVALWDTWQAGDREAAVAAQQSIDLVRDALGGGARLADFKAVLVARGVLASAAVRAPHAPGEDGERLLATLRGAGADIGEPATASVAG